MHVERLLQINVATLAAMSTFMVGMGHQEVILPLTMLLAAMLSVWFTDITGKLVLNREVAKVAAVVALLISIPEAMQLEKTSLITAVGGFLIYLQIIHLFQKKDPRVYSLLLRFSLLQVVVAALLIQGFFFGFLLVVYLFTALSALLLYHLYAERVAHQATVAPAAEESASAARWPWSRERATVASPVSGSSAVQREMFWRLFRMGLVALGLSIVVFFLVPRVGRGAWRGGQGVRMSVGFSNTVALGEFGKIIENPEEVLRVAFFDEAGIAPYEIRDEVYLRGSILNDYHGGQWRMLPHVNSVPELFGTAPGGATAGRTGCTPADHD